VKAVSLGFSHLKRDNACKRQKASRRAPETPIRFSEKNVEKLLTMPMKGAKMGFIGDCRHRQPGLRAPVFW
jgi:hypothetical protein